ncbi:MAG: ATP-binding cassette domain-containing protein, partial [Sphingobacterium sp.]
NYVSNKEPLWNQNIDIQIKSGDRIAFAGSNGSGKTTLVKVLLGALSPQNGTIERAQLSSVYIDQNYSLLDHHLTVYHQAEAFNSGKLEEHEVKIRLNRFLFNSMDWDKRCETLSGGERMRLALCCLTISASAPDLIVLDEPTNNLDLENIEMLTTAILDYQGTLLVISHDSFFLQEVGITTTVNLDPLKRISETKNS